METVWIKNPQTIYTVISQDTRGGIVVKGNTIVELVSQCAQPTVWSLAWIPNV